MLQSNLYLQENLKVNLDNLVTKISRTFEYCKSRLNCINVCAEWWRSYFSSKRSKSVPFFAHTLSFPIHQCAVTILKKNERIYRFPSFLMVKSEPLSLPASREKMKKKKKNLIWRLLLPAIFHLFFLLFSLFLHIYAFWKATIFFTSFFLGWKKKLGPKFSLFKRCKRYRRRKSAYWVFSTVVARATTAPPIHHFNR